MRCALLALTQVRKVYFDYNLLNMQSEGLPAVVFEQKLIDSADKSVLFGAVVADSPEQAVELEKQIQAIADGCVERRCPWPPYLAEDQTEKLKLIGEIKQDVAPLQFKPPDAQPVNIEDLSRTLYSIYGYLGLAADEIKDSNDPALTEQLISLRDAINDLAQGKCWRR